MDNGELEVVTTRMRQLRENLDMLRNSFDKLAVNAEVAGKLQQVDKKLVQGHITGSFVAMYQLWEALEQPLLKAMKKPPASPVASVMVQNSVPIAGDSVTPSKEDLSVSSAYGPIDDEAETSDSHPKLSGQPLSSGVKEDEINLRPHTDKGKSKVETGELVISPFQVYQQTWEKLMTRQGINPLTCEVDVSGIYPRVWMKPNAHPKDVKLWYDFGALASVSTVSPGFPEISGLPKWIQDAVHETWAYNDQLSRGDILELYFFSAAPEPVGKGSHEAFHFIKLRRPDGDAWKNIKSPPVETPIVSTMSEDAISTRRALGLWVCLIEMDKYKRPFKLYQNSVNGSFLINTMTNSRSNFAEEVFEKKRILLFNNKLPASKETRRKFCNMIHAGRWIEKICPECPNQKEPEYGKHFRPRSDRKHYAETRPNGEGPSKSRMPRAPFKNKRFPDKEKGGM